MDNWDDLDNEGQLSYGASLLAVQTVFALGIAFGLLWASMSRDVSTQGSRAPTSPI